MEMMKSGWKLRISLLLFGKRLMRWQEDWLVGNSSAISKQNLTIFMTRERRKTWGPLLRCCFFSDFLGEKKYLTDSIREIKDLPIQLAYFSYFRIKILFLVCKGGEVMERNLTLTTNWIDGRVGIKTNENNIAMNFQLSFKKYMMIFFNFLHSTYQYIVTKWEINFSCVYFKRLPKMIWTHQPKSPNECIKLLIVFFMN